MACEENIHLYYTSLEQIRNRALMDRYYRILSPAESESIKKITSGVKRCESLVTRALVRFVLAGCCKTGPEALRFYVNRYGKPSLLPGVTPLPFRFNLSHCPGLVGCAVTCDADVGLDMEDKNRCVNLNLARRFFSEPEIKQLEKIPDTAARRAFFLQLWTLKEAYVKAVGKGLSHGMDHFSFVFNRGRPDIRFAPDSPAVSGIWHFFSAILLDRYTVAVGVGSPKKKRPNLHLHECIPFDSTQYKGQIL